MAFEGTPERPSGVPTSWWIIFWVCIAVTTGALSLAFWMTWLQLTAFDGNLSARLNTVEMIQESFMNRMNQLENQLFTVDQDSDANADEQEKHLKNHELLNLHEAHPIPADHWVPSNKVTR